MFRISLFGEFSLQDQNGEPVKLTVRNAQLLLAYLLLEGGGARERIFDRLWPEELEHTAEHRLRQAIYSLRKVLEPKGTPKGTYVVVKQRMVYFNVESPHWCDASVFQKCIDDKDKLSGNEKAQRLEEAVALYQGELLEKCYDDWCIDRRIYFHDKYLEILKDLVELHIAEEKYDSALSYALQSIAHNPRQERIYHHLIHLHYMMGDRAGALQHYRDCEAILQEDGFEPLPETQALYEEIKSHSAVKALKQVVAKSDAPTLKLDSPFVGRKDELEQLVRALKAVQSDAGQTFMVSGEAGVGKTRLAQEILLFAIEQDYFTFSGRCYEIEGKLPYQPVIEAIRGCLPQITKKDLKKVPQSALGEVIKLVPELQPLAPKLHTSASLNAPDQERNRLYESVSVFFKTIADERPVLLFVDDLQWADDATLQLLAYLMRHLRDANVFILGTYRIEDVDEQHPLWDMLQHLVRDALVTTMPLAPLASEEVQSMIHGLLETEAMETFGQRIYEESKGYPFYTEELVKSFIEVGALTQNQKGSWQVALDKLPADYVSPNVSALVGTRLRRLDQKSRDMLESIAVLGRGLTFNFLTKILGRWHDDIYAPLETLIKGRFLEEHHDRYQYHHDMTRQVIYRGLSKERRRLMHLRVAETLENLREEESETAANELLGDMSFHFHKAHRWRKALKYSLEAGHYVWTKLYAKEDALRFFQRALTLAEKLDDQEALLNSYKGLSEVCCFSDEHEKGLEYSEKALALSSNPEDRAEVYCAMASVYHNKRKMETGLSYCEKALKELGSDHVSLIAIKVLFYASNFLNWLSQPDQAIKYCSRGLKVLEKFPDDNWKARILAQLGNALSRKGEYEVAIEHLQNALQLSEKTGDLNSVNQTNFNIALAFFNNGRFEQAKEYWKNSLEITQQIGHLSREMAAIYNWLATVCILRKELDHALVYAEEQLKSNIAAKRNEGIASSYSMLGCLYDVTGSVDQAKEAFSQALDLAPKNGTTYQAIILTYLRLDYSDKALIWLRKGAPYLEQRHIKHLNSCPAFPTAFINFRENQYFKDLLKLE